MAKIHLIKQSSPDILTILDEALGVLAAEVHRAKKIAEVDGLNATQAKVFLECVNAALRVSNQLDDIRAKDLFSTLTPDQQAEWLRKVQRENPDLFLEQQGNSKATVQRLPSNLREIVEEKEEEHAG